MIAAKARCGSFSPFVVTVDGTLGPGQYYFSGALRKSCLLDGGEATGRY